MSFLHVELRNLVVKLNNKCMLKPFTNCLSLCDPHAYILLRAIMISRFRLSFQQFTLLRPFLTLINTIIFAFCLQISVTSLNVALQRQETIC